MDISAFTDRLYAAIIEKGIEPEIASKYINQLKPYLRPEDVAGITDSDIDESVRICLETISGGTDLNSDNADTADQYSDTENDSDFLDELFSSNMDPVTSNAATAIFETPVQKESTVDDTVPDVSAVPNDNVDNGAFDDYIPYDDPKTQTKTKEKITPRGVAMLVLITLASSPLWLLASVLFFLPFAAMFIAEFALTAALVCALAGVAALGAAASLTGIIYGIVMSFTDSITGVYEIGFAIIIAGVTMIVCVLVYNGAVRFMPWVIKKTSVFFKFAFSKIKPLIQAYKRWCTNL